MAPNPAARHTTARALADELDQWLLTQQRPRARLSSRSVRALCALAAGLFFLIGIGWALRPQTHPPDSPDRETGGHPGTSETLLPADSSPPYQPATKGGQGEKIGSWNTTAGAPPDEVHLIGNLESHKYHLDTCYYAKAMAVRHRIVLKSHEQAKSQHYSPCEACLSTGSKPAPPPEAVRP